MRRHARPAPASQRLEVVIVGKDEDSSGRGEQQDPGKADEGAGGERWVRASDAVQTTAKWIITALAAVGAVMFAKGFVTTPTLDIEDDTGQLLLAWLLGVVGIIGIGLLIWATSRILFPTVITLSSMPSEFRKLADADPQDYFPSGATSVRDFDQRLREYRRAALHVPTLVRQAERDLEQAESSGSQERVRDAQHRLDDIKSEVATVIANRDLYLAKRQELLDRAQFWQASHGYSTRSPLVFVGAGMAAIGGIGFQLALATPEAGDESADGGGPALSFPRSAQLVQLENPAGASFWQAVGLQDCEVTSELRPTVPVLVLAGVGTPESPYSLSTILTEQCPQLTFPVINDVAVLIEEPAVSITYTPAEPSDEDATTSP